MCESNLGSPNLSGDVMNNTLFRCPRAWSIFWYYRLPCTQQQQQLPFSVGGRLTRPPRRSSPIPMNYLMFLLSRALTDEHAAACPLATGADYTPATQQQQQQQQHRFGHWGVLPYLRSNSILSGPGGCQHAPKVLPLHKRYN